MHLWPKIADLLNMPYAGCRPQTLQKSMVEMDNLWQTLVKKNGLQPYSLNRICDWAFADYILKTEWDVMASTIKIREAGFTTCMDTELMYLRMIDQMQKLKIIP